MNRKLIVVLISAVVLSGCQTMGVGNKSTSDYSSMKDSTGSLGEETRKSQGDVYVKLAAEHLRQGNMPAALKNNKKALGIDPENGQSHSLMAVIYQRIGEDQLSEKHYQKAISLLEGDSYIHNGYGAFLCMKQRYSEADSQFSKALANPLYRTPEVALTNAGDCAKRQGDFSRAESLLRKSLKYNKNLPKTLFLMSEIMLENQDSISARSYLKRFHSQSLESAQSLWLAIRIAKKLGDSKAVAVFEAKMKTTYPDSEYVTKLRGRG